MNKSQFFLIFDQVSIRKNGNENHGHETGKYNDEDEGDPQIACFLSCFLFRSLKILIAPNARLSNKLLTILALSNDNDAVIWRSMLSAHSLLAST